MSILTNAAKSGNDVLSFETFYEKYYAIVYARVFKALRHREDTEDVVQEIFFKASRAWDSLAHHDYLGAWLWTITTRSLMDFHRYYRSRGHLLHEPLEEANQLIDEQAPDPYDLCDASELSERFVHTWQTLPTQHRRVLSLLAQDFSADEITTLLGHASKQRTYKVSRNACDAFKRRYRRREAA